MLDVWVEFMETFMLLWYYIVNVGHFSASMQWSFLHLKQITETKVNNIGGGNHSRKCKKLKNTKTQNEEQSVILSAGHSMWMILEGMVT